MKKNGLIYIFTGNGKGKTSAALGTVTRAVCAGKKIAWVAWYKSDTWDISEKKIPQILSGSNFNLMGKGFYIKEAKNENQKSIKKIKILKTGGKVVDLAQKSEHKKAALNALKKAEEILSSKEYFLLVCDEICNAVNDGLLSLTQVKHILNLRGETHIILTGRNAVDYLIKQADLVSEIKNIKHPYDKGISAVKGLDF